MVNNYITNSRKRTQFKQNSPIIGSELMLVYAVYVELTNYILLERILEIEEKRKYSNE